MASPGKQLFTIILIIRWLQIKGLPGLHEQAPKDCGETFGVVIADSEQKAEPMAPPDSFQMKY